MHPHSTRLVRFALLAVGLALPQPVDSAAPPTRPDWHSDPLPTGAAARLGTLRLRHGDRISSVAFSPDGKTVASSGFNRVVLWDVATGLERHRLGGGFLDVKSIDFTPDGKTLVGGGGQFSRQTYFWDAGSGKLIRTLGKQPPFRTIGSSEPWAHARSIALSPDGKTAASATCTEHSTSNEKGRITLRYEYFVVLTDIATGRESRRIAGEENADRFVCVAYSPDGKTIAGGYEDGTICYYNSATGAKVRTSRVPGGCPLCLDFSPDSKTLAVGDMDGWVRLWDASTGKQARLIERHGKPVRSVLFTPDGKHLIAGGTDRVSLRETRSAKVVRLFRGHDGKVVSLALSRDGKRLAGAGGDGAVRIWDVGTGESVLPFDGHRAHVFALAFSPKGDGLASAGYDGVLVWDWRKGTMTRKLGGEGMAGFALSYSPNGASLAVVHHEQGLRLWDVKTGKSPVEFKSQKDHAEYVSFAPGGKTLISRHESGFVRVWERSTGRGLREFGLNKSESQFGRGLCAPSPDGTLVATWGINERTKFWRIADGKLIRELDRVERESALAGAFSPDGKLFACGHREICFGEVATGKVLRRMKGHKSEVHALVFSPDGRTLASAGDDAEIRLWEVATGGERQRLKGHRGNDCPVAALAFSRDGRRLASAGEDTTILLWDMTATGKNKPRGKPPSAAELATAWETLAGADAARAYDSIRCLACAGDSCPQLLGQHLRLSKEPDPKQIARLITDLDSEEYALREKASRALEQMKDQVRLALEAALRGPSAETRRRAKRLLATLATEQLRESRAVEALEGQAGPASEQLLRTLAMGAPTAHLTREAESALRRLNRLTDEER